MNESLLSKVGVSTVLLGVFPLLLRAQTPTIEQQFQKEYTTTVVASTGSVSRPGTVLIVKQDGIKAIPASYEAYFANTLKQGGRIKPNVVQHIGTRGGGGGSPFHPAYLDEARILQVDEKVYLTKVEFNKDTEIVFSVQSCGVCDFSTVDQNNPPFRASLAFQFPKGYLSTTSFKDVQGAIAQVFATDASATAQAPGKAHPAAAAELRLPATYVNAQTSSDQLQLGADHTLSLREGGQDYHGTFSVEGNTLQINLAPDRKTNATLEGDRLTDASGQTWILQGQSGAPAASEGVLRNQDIIALVSAGVPEADILAKIASSKCQFDTTTDAILQLSRAGASPAILKAVRGGGK
jgi:hypothetical protein